MATQAKDRMVYVLVAIYCSIVLFGNLFRLGGSEDAKTDFGVSTAVLLLIVLLKFKHLPGALFKNDLFAVILVLLLWSFISALFSVTSVMQAYFIGVMLVIYLFAAASVYNTYIPPDRARLLLYLLSISILIASILTIVDFLNIINVPLVNENIASTKMSGERIEQAGGFFSKRTSMAAYYSLVIPALLYYGLNAEGARAKIFMFATAAVSYLALFFTHNRSGIVGILLALFLYMLFDKQVKIGRRLRMLLVGSVLLMIFLMAAFTYFPTHMDVYLMKLNNYLPGAGMLSEYQTEANYERADYSRVYFFKTVMESLLTNPVGNGFSKIYSQDYGESSPHNIISFVIWSAGLLAFVWIPLFVYRVAKDFKTTAVRTGDHFNDNILIIKGAFQVGLLSWLINNMAHVSVSTGLAWIYLGLVLNLARQINEETRSARDVELANQNATASTTRIIAARQQKILRVKSSSGR